MKFVQNLQEPNKMKEKIQTIQTELRTIRDTKEENDESRKQLSLKIAELTGQYVQIERKLLKEQKEKQEFEEGLNQMREEAGTKSRIDEINLRFETIRRKGQK